MRDVLAYPLMLATVALTCAGFVPTTQAQDASSWDGEPHGSSRLIAGAAHNTGDKKLARAGIEIRLDPGWKTYWRYPGDSGVPPTLDFAGSENVKSVSTLWPAPERFADGAGGYSIGYHGDVVLPLQIIPNDAAKPSVLHVKLGYAVCGKLCVPAEAQHTLTLSGKRGRRRAGIGRGGSARAAPCRARRARQFDHRFGPSRNLRQARARCRSCRSARRRCRRSFC